MDFLFSWGFIIPTAILLFMYGSWRSVHGGYKKYKYPNSSSLNPVTLISGLKWTAWDKLQKKFKKRGKNDVFIGYFRFSPKVLEECNPPYFYRKYVENISIWFRLMHMKQTTMIWGGMGSGKSIFLINLLSQNHTYENAIVHDGGKGEMVSKFYNPFRDIIFNPYDERASIHDLLSEDTAIQRTFFELLMNAANSSDKKNYFTTGAMEHLQNIAYWVQKENFSTTKEKWEFFIARIDELIDETQDESQKSEKDVVGTLKQVLQPLYLMNFRIQDGAKTFTVDEFLERSHAAKLYVSYPPKLSSLIKPVSSAFVALYTLIHLSRPDTKKKFYYYIVDEFSSYLRTLNNDEVLKDQLEKLRSKGGMFVGGLQGEEEEVSISEIIDKTIKNKFYFRTDGRKTKNALIERVGQVTFEVQNHNKEGRGLNMHKTNTYSESLMTQDLIKEDDFDELGEKYEYIAMIDNILYRGYTPLPPEEIELEERKKENPDAEEEDLTRTKGYVEYSKRKEFEDSLAIRYENFQKEKFRKNREKALAKKVI